MKTNKPQHVIATSASTFSLMRKKGERRKKRKWLMQVAKSHVQGI